MTEDHDRRSEDPLTDVAVTANPASSSGGWRRRAAVGAAAIFLCGGGAFAASELTTASSAAGGAKSPEGAVNAMLSSLENNDVLGMLDQLAPGESDVMRDATVDYVDELVRLNVLSDGVEPSDVEGFESSFENMTYEVSTANERVSLVEITGGQVTVGVNPAALPLGDVILDRIDPLPEGRSQSMTFDIAEELDGSTMPLRVAVVEEDGQFYVSAFYTAAETLAAAGGYKMPAEPIPAVGAATPEEAVVGMANAAIALDVERVIELTPPDEMAALHDYGAILVELADEAIAEPGFAEDFGELDITLDEYRFDTVDVSGGMKLLPVHIAFTLTVEDEGTFVFSATKVDETCVDYEFTITSIDASDDDDEAGRYCASDIYEAFEGSSIPIEVQQIAERQLGQLGQLGFVTVEVDGAWYVSPTRTSTDLLLVAMQGLEPGDIETLLDWFTAPFSFDLDD